MPRQKPKARGYRAPVLQFGTLITAFPDLWLAHGLNHSGSDLQGDC